MGGDACSNECAVGATGRSLAGSRRDELPPRSVDDRADEENGESDRRVADVRLQQGSENDRYGERRVEDRSERVERAPERPRELGPRRSEAQERDGDQGVEDPLDE